MSYPPYGGGPGYPPAGVCKYHRIVQLITDCVVMLIILCYCFVVVNVSNRVISQTSILIC